MPCQIVQIAQIVCLPACLPACLLLPKREKRVTLERKGKEKRKNIYFKKRIKSIYLAEREKERERNLSYGYGRREKTHLLAYFSKVNKRLSLKFKNIILKVLFYRYNCARRVFPHLYLDRFIQEA